MTRFLSKAVALLGAVVLAMAIAGCDSGSDESSAFVGKYKTMDTEGQEMTITLDDDGSASGQRADESLDGSWKQEDGNSVMITWSDNWTTKIAKDGDKYSKTAYKDGTQDGDTVAAEKLE